MNKYFVLKSANRDITIVPKNNDFEKVIGEFTEFYNTNKNFFKGCNKFYINWNGDFSYELLYNLEKQNIKIDLIRISQEQFSNLIEKKPIIYKRIIRGGEIIKHDGDIIIEGNVNPDAQIISTDDIYILGTLKGTVHAGYNNDLTKKIIIFDYETAQVRIGNKIKFFTKKKDISIRPKIFCCENNEIIVKDF